MRSGRSSSGRPPHFNSSSHGSRQRLQSLGQASILGIVDGTVDHDRAIASQGLSQRRFEFRWTFHSQSSSSETLGEGHKVWIPKIDGGGSPEPKLPLRYELLAFQAYREGKLSEGQFADFLELDRVSARERAEVLESQIGAEHEGTFKTLSLPLFRTVTGG